MIIRIHKHRPEMRVGLVSNSYWNIYHFRQPIGRALRRAGYAVYCIAPDDAYKTRLERLGFACHSLNMRQTTRNPWHDLYVCFQLWRMYRRLKLKLALQYTIKLNIYGSIAAALCGIPSVCNVSGLGTTFMQRNLVRRVVCVLYRVAFSCSRYIFFQNTSDHDYFQRLFRLSPKAIGLVPGSGINTRVYVPRLRLLKPPKAAPCVFVMMARLLKDKGVVEYAQAAEYVLSEGFSAHFLLVGAYLPEHPRSVSPEDFECWVRKGTIEYKGYVEDIADVVAMSDCVVLPSYREGVPRSLLEGAAMAKPLIATHVPGCKDVVIEGYNGLLCSPHSAAELAKAMETFLRMDESKRALMGRHSRQVACARFDERFVVSAYMDKVRTLLPA